MDGAGISGSDRDDPKGAKSEQPVILLQGAISGFFGALAESIEKAHGVAAIKIQFNWADSLRDRAIRSIEYNGNLDDLEAWYATLFAQLNPRAVVCFGDERPVHVAARRVCRAQNIRFYAFDEGYVRPDYVTLEEGGTSANSRYRSETLTEAHGEIRNPTSYGRNILAAALDGMVYNALLAMGKPLFPRYVHHRHRPFWSDAVNWTRWFFYNRTLQGRDIRRSEAFVAKNARAYYIVALQVYDDLQLRRHGRGWTPESLIVSAIESFSSFAPTEAQLVIKQHPLDTGHRDYVRLISETAARCRVKGRVELMRYANQMDLLKQALGVITVNSTLGISALQFGCPVLALGDCIYSRPGLAASGTSKASIDAFWAGDRSVDAELFQRFRTTLVANTQINGDFYISKAWKGMFEPVCDAILGSSSRGEFTPVQNHPSPTRQFAYKENALKDLPA